MFSESRMTAFLAAVFGTVAMAVSGASVSYVDTRTSGNAVRTCASYTRAESSDAAVEWGVAGQEKWYVVEAGDSVSIPKGVTVLGSVKLILGNRATLDVGGDTISSAGIFVGKDHSFDVYRQSSTTETAGFLRAHGGTSSAGIGGTPNTQGVTNRADSGAIFIGGGRVEAVGGQAGIGGGYRGNGVSITINGAEVTARGGNGAGVGGGESGAGRKISIVGSTVTATSKAGAGIGGGQRGEGSSIVVDGATVTAAGGANAAGIGGACAAGYDIAVRGDSVVSATGGNYAAGIGGGRGEGHGISVKAGTLRAVGGRYGAAVGGGYASGYGIAFSGSPALDLEAGAEAGAVGGWRKAVSNDVTFAYALCPQVGDAWTSLSNLSITAGVDVSGLLADNRFLISRLTALRFISAQPFAFAVSGSGTMWNGTMEVSADGGATWKTLSASGASATADTPVTDGSYALFFRGTGNNRATDGTGRWTFSGEDTIAVVGPVEALLDWNAVVSGAHPTMNANAFAGMFEDCTLLTTLPEMPAGNIPAGACAHMFRGCTGIALYEDGCGATWSVPAGGTFGSGWNADMFAGTSGAFTGDPVPGTVYSYEPARYVTIRAPKSACFDGCVTNGVLLVAEEDGSYIVREGAVVDLCWTAPEDEEFVDGTTSMTNRCTASSAWRTPSAPETYPVVAFVFESAKPFSVTTPSLGLLGGMFELSVSTDKRSWTKFDQLQARTFNAASGVDGAYRLFFRGGNRHSLNASSDPNNAQSWAVNGTDVRVSGSYAALLDADTVRTGGTPAMDAAAFAHLFYGQTAVTAVPDIVFDAIPEHAFNRAFASCSSLAHAPAVVASSVSTNAFNRAFFACNELTVPSELDIKNVSSRAFDSAFLNCTGLALYENGDGCAWTARCANASADWATDMFSGTSGSFQGAPVPGRGYFFLPPKYVSLSAPADVAHASYVFTTNGADAAFAPDGTLVVRTNAVVEAVWTAEDGYEFGADISALTNRFTASSDPQTWPEAARPVARKREVGLKFASASAFTLATSAGRRWNGKMEVSADGVTWTNWTGDVVAAGASGDAWMLYVRGVGNTLVSAGAPGWTITGTGVSVEGDLALLLDHTVYRSNRWPAASDRAFAGLFAGSTSLVSVASLAMPDLPSYAYESLFENCTSLSNAPALPALSVPKNAYARMFAGCTALACPVPMSGTNYGYGACRRMYAGCTSFIPADEEHATAWSVPADAVTNASWAVDMFADTAAPVAGAPVPGKVYRFGDGHVYVLIRPIDVDAVPHGHFVSIGVNGAVVAPSADGYYAVPSNAVVTATWRATPGWEFGFDAPTCTVSRTICDAETDGAAFIPSDPAPITAVRFESPEAFTFSESKDRFCSWTGNGGKLFVSSNGVDWTEWNTTSAQEWTSARDEEGMHRLYFRGVGSTRLTHIPPGYFVGTSFKIKGEDVGAYGVMESMLDYPSVRNGTPVVPDAYGYQYLFKECYALVHAPDITAPELKKETCAYMFADCHYLTAAPRIEAVKVGDSACMYMFDECWRMTNAPVLHATVLDKRCYYGMFDFCSALEEAPALPVLDVSGEAYAYMFYGCKALRKPPALPATTVGEEGYRGMFWKCPALALYDAPNGGAAWSMPGNLVGGTSWNADMFKECKGPFTGTPEAGAVYYLEPDRFVAILPPEDACFASLSTNGVALVPGIDGTYTVLSNASVTVTWSAPVGGEFDDGTVERTEVFTASSAVEDKTGLAAPAYAAVTAVFFESPNPFTVSVPVWGSRRVAPFAGLECSPDGHVWTRVLPNHTTRTCCEAGDAGGVWRLYLRGSDMRSLGWSTDPAEAEPWSIEGEDVRMSGDLYALLDVAAVRENRVRESDAAAFARLFEGCTSLTAIPDIVMPDTVAASALERTFAACTSLERLPSILIGSAEPRAFAETFADCTGIALYENGNGETWTLDALDVPADDWATNMFAGTTGSLQDAPVPGVGYFYDPRQPLSFLRPPEVEHASMTLYVDGEPFDYPEGTSQIVSSNAVVAAVYTADDGWEFDVDVTVVTNAFAVTSDAQPWPAAPAAHEAVYGLLFTSPTFFSLSTREKPRWNGTMQISSDGRMWTTWDGGTFAAANIGGTWTLYVRGTGNTIVTGGGKGWQIDGMGVSVTGELALLLDHREVRSGRWPCVNDRAYANLFADVDALVGAPSLGAPVLAKYVYERLFAGCSSLRAAPALPAAEVPDYAYARMFENCTLLAIPAEMAGVRYGYYACRRMYAGCSSMRPGPNQTGAPWSVPAGAETNAFWAAQMFADTASSVSEYPAPGVVYRFDDGIDYVRFIPPEARPEHTTFAVYSGGEVLVPETNGCYIVLSNAVVSARWMADPGYAFEDGMALFQRSMNLRTDPAVWTGDLPGDVVAVPAFVFSSTSPFTLGYSSESYPWTTLYVSQEGTTWTEWSSATCSSWEAAATTAGPYVLYLRGEGNTRLSDGSGSFTLTGSGAVTAAGAIDYLLNWRTALAGGSCVLQAGACEGLFRDCTALVAAPALTASAVPESAYESMFEGCTGLTAFPMMPTPTSCGARAMKRMFAGCTSLVVYKDGHGDVWRAPPSGGADWGFEMFAGCAGPAAATPVVDTYYGNVEPPTYTLSVPAAREGTVLKLYADGASVSVREDGTYTFYSNTSVRAVYETAAPGYAFPGGAYATERTLCVVTDGMTWPDGFPEETEEDVVVQFVSPKPFALRTEYLNEALWDGTLEVSTDGRVWSVWDGAPASAALCGVGDYRLLLRGKNNTRLSFDWHYSVRNGFMFEGEDVSDVSARGSLEALFDCEVVRAGNHPEMAPDACRGLFKYCDALVSAPDLTAPYVPESGYCAMFAYSGIETAPVIAATNLGDYACQSMFEGCTSLTNAPALPATALGVYAYRSMFEACTSLTNAPALPATVLATNCYESMFAGCASLTNAPALPASDVPPYAYNRMFAECSSLVAAPALPAVVLGEGAYEEMFEGCTALTAAPELPAANVADSAYCGMFWECTALTHPSDLLAERIGVGSYSAMYFGCSSLTRLPKIAVRVAGDGALSGMFYECTSLAVYEGRGLGEAWSLAADIEGGEYWNMMMFYGCAGPFCEDPTPGRDYYCIQPETMGAVVPASVEQAECIGLYTNGVRVAVAKDGYCYVAYGATVEARWRAPRGYEFEKDRPVYAVAQEATRHPLVWTNDVPATVEVVAVRFEGDEPFALSLKTPGRCGWTVSPGGRMYVSTNAADWTEWDGSSEQHWPSAVDADGVNVLYLRGSGNTALYCASSLGSPFRIEGGVARAYGVVETLLDHDAVRNGTSITLGKSAFQSLFSGCANLARAPDIASKVLPEYACASMFSGCSCLKAVPRMCVEALNPYACALMFESCTSLTNTAELAVLDVPCGAYKGMFAGCTALREAPSLPATNVAESAYQEMFSGCSSLTRLPDIAARTCGDSAFACMFFHCSSLAVYLSGTGEAWRLDPDLVGGEDWNANMLFATPGQVKGGLEPGVAYYFTDPVRYELSLPSCPEKTTFDVQVDGTSVSTYLPGQTCSFYSNSVVTVKYEVIPGTVFSDGSYVREYTIAVTNENLSFPEGFPGETQDDNAVLLVSSEPFTLSADGAGGPVWDGTVEVFGEGNAWSVWNGSSVAARYCYHVGETGLSAVDYRLLVRGTGNTCLSYNLKISAGAPWVIEGTNVSAYGSIEILFDYASVRAGTHPVMSAGACFGLFANCTALTRAPELTARDVAVRGYAQMFVGCTSLSAAPELPATNVGDYAYCEMFAGCTALTRLPEIAVRQAGEKALSEMFSACTSLVLYEKSGSGESWSLNADLVGGLMWNSLMFEGCAGPFCGLPEPGVSYYYKAPAPAILPALPEPCANAFAVLLVDNSPLEPEKDGTFLVPEGTEVTVWYGAAPGYVFDEGTGWVASCTVPQTTYPWETNSFPSSTHYVPTLVFKGWDTFTVEAPDGKTWDGTVQVMRPDGTWMDWTGDGVDAYPYFDPEEGAVPFLAFRGSGNTFMGGTWTIDGAPVRAEGNLGALLDYETETAGHEPTMAPGAFKRLFSGCEMLIKGPDVPQTGDVPDEAFRGLFEGCRNLVSCCDLPATNVGHSAYAEMYRGCRSLEESTAFVMVSFGTNACASMFRECTGLIQSLPIIDFAASAHCYESMYEGCGNLGRAEYVTIINVGESACRRMFAGCASLESVDSEFADVGVYGCAEMYAGCTSLTSVDVLGATNLCVGAFSNMFAGCTSLAKVRALFSPYFTPTASAGSCAGMFADCTALRLFTSGTGDTWSVPSDLVAEPGWSADMFAGCPGPYTADPAPGTSLYFLPNTVWLDPLDGYEHVSFAGYSVNGTPCDTDDFGRYEVYEGIPVEATWAAEFGYDFGTNGWQIVRTNDVTATEAEWMADLPAAEKVCAVVFESAKSFGINFNGNTGNGAVWFSFDSHNWRKYDPALYSSTVYFSEDEKKRRAADGKYRLFVRGTGNTYLTSGSYNSSTYGWFFMDSAVSASGSIEYLLDWETVRRGEHPPMGAYAFYRLFAPVNPNFILLTSPDLTPTNLTASCYREMFYQCALTNPPALPATVLAPNCYDGMFKLSKQLTVAPALPATVLADYCYYGMFWECAALERAPDLPATHVPAYAYQYMFLRCTSLGSMPAMSASSFGDYAMYQMFFGCSSMPVYENVGSGNRWTMPDYSGTAVNGVFANCAGPFKGTPQAGHTYWSDPPQLQQVKFVSADPSPTFAAAPALAAAAVPSASELVPSGVELSITAVTPDAEGEVTIDVAAWAPAKGLTADVARLHLFYSVDFVVWTEVSAEKTVLPDGSARMKRPMPTDACGFWRVVLED